MANPRGVTIQVIPSHQARRPLVIDIMWLRQLPSVIGVQPWLKQNCEKLGK